MQLTTLIENYVEQKSLLAEHGLSMLIDTGAKNILFDTGQTDNFLLNAQALGIDVVDIDYVVLSHGHYDHTGGLYPFLKANKKATIICKKEVFEGKYNDAGKFIGTLWQEDLLKERTIFIDKITELTPGVFIVPDITIHHPLDTHFEGLKKMTDNGLVPDDMQDELFIAILFENKMNILTACSHNGISNICRTASDIFKLPVATVTGGFHLRHCSADQYNFLVKYFQKMPDTILGTSHCTGVEKFSKLQRDLGNPLFYNYTGKCINF